MMTRSGTTILPWRFWLPPYFEHRGNNLPKSFHIKHFKDGIVLLSAGRMVYRESKQVFEVWQEFSQTCQMTRMFPHIIKLMGFLSPHFLLISNCAEMTRFFLQFSEKRWIAFAKRRRRQKYCYLPHDIVAQMHHGNVFLQADKSWQYTLLHFVVSDHPWNWRYKFLIALQYKVWVNFISYQNENLKSDFWKFII